ncbi:polysaccharide pyruvyl transferase family protein [Arthrobacter sp. AK01]|uniref:polysaccharide pyruvyl transferase family protein n=1 Tax=Arthrobacter sp. AK01 TaxID=2894084 RepID=UPI001E594358|nr:polysaccharide pyruvyl transferase family protein [Arthrobacter sp. AK01]MCD4852203.1 polysaccharide pyruvyl transferase family protein [Arthrobacter sp. AK01]
MVSIYGVEVFAWNPVRADVSGRMCHVNNFGDLLGPALVGKLAQKQFFEPILSDDPENGSAISPKLLTVGSIMHFAGDLDTVWGSGVNGKVGVVHHKFSKLDLRALRGPLSGKWLEEHKGIEDPGVYGDPALLLLDAMPNLADLSQQKRFKLSVIPNFHDFDTYRDLPEAVNPRGSVIEILTRLAQSEQIVASSLHGLIVGELLGIPTALFKPSQESIFKYEDYVMGTGRKGLLCHATLDDAVRALAGDREIFDEPLALWDPAPLRQSFPSDLWEPGKQ